MRPVVLVVLGLWLALSVLAAALFALVARGGAQQEQGHGPRLVPVSRHSSHR